MQTAPERSAKISLATVCSLYKSMNHGRGGLSQIFFLTRLQEVSSAPCLYLTNARLGSNPLDYKKDDCVIKGGCPHLQINGKLQQLYRVHVGGCEGPSESAGAQRGHQSQQPEPQRTRPASSA